LPKNLEIQMHNTQFSPDVYVYEIRFLTARKIKTLMVVQNGGGNESIGLNRRELFYDGKNRLKPEAS
jgi:hypothetical protein